MQQSQNVFIVSAYTDACTSSCKIVVASKRPSIIKQITNQEKEKSISDLLVMARHEHVAFDLSLASSSSELMNARMASLNSSFPLESMASLSYCHFHSFHCCQHLPALLSFSVNVLAFLSVARLALRGLLRCMHDSLTIAFTFSLLLIFKCRFSPVVVQVLV